MLELESTVSLNSGAERYARIRIHCKSELRSCKGDVRSCTLETAMLACTALVVTHKIFPTQYR